MGLECCWEIILRATFSQGKILDLTGHIQQKDKSEKESKKESKSKSKKHSSTSGSFSSGATGGGQYGQFGGRPGSHLGQPGGEGGEQEVPARVQGQAKTVIKKKISEWKFNVHVWAKPPTLQVNLKPGNHCVNQDTFVTVS